MAKKKEDNRVMSVELTKEKDGEWLIIKAPVKRYISKSEKSIVLASTHGNQQTEAKDQGETITVGVNAYCRNPDYKK